MTNTEHKSEAQRPFIVCPTCEGEGSHGPGWVYTVSELDEAFGPDVDEYLEDMRRGRYNVTCEECGGQRVIRSACDCDGCEEAAREEYEYRALVAAELRAGC